jgi:hypothetical protein
MEKNTHASQGRLKNGRFRKKRRHGENNNNITEEVEEVEGRRVDRFSKERSLDENNNTTIDQTDAGNMDPANPDNFIGVEGRRIIDLQFFTDQLDRGCLACKRPLTFRRYM